LDTDESVADCHFDNSNNESLSLSENDIYSSDKDHCKDDEVTHTNVTFHNSNIARECVVIVQNNDAQSSQFFG